MDLGDLMVTQTLENCTKNIMTQKTLSYNDLEGKCVSQMSADGFQNVNLPLNTSGETINFAGRNGDSRDLEWYKASIKENGTLMVTYNSHHSSLHRDDNYKFISELSNPLDEKEVQEIRERVAKTQQERGLSDAEKEQERSRKALRDRERFKKASETGNSLYLERKRVGAHGIRFEIGKQETVVLVPMLDENWELQALQEIYQTKKLFAREEKPRDKNFTNSTKGLFCLIGNIVDGQEIRVSEGYATAASCFESTGCNATHVVAFSANAYRTIIPIIRKLYPNSPILICADNNNHDNPDEGVGVKEAKQAADSLGNCSVVYPVFLEGKNKNKAGEAYADFNDLMIISGKEEVKRQIEQINQATFEIEITPGNLPHMTDKAESVLVSKKSGIYQRSGRLVRIITESTKPKAKESRNNNQPVNRAEDALVIAEVDHIYLTEVLSKSCKWMRFDERTQQLKQKDCPEKVAKTLIARRQWEQLPVLSGIIQAPTVRSDGSILEIPGYDSLT